MKVFLTDQSKHFPGFLSFFKQQPVMPYDRNQLAEKITIVTINTTRPFEELDTRFLFAYKIFPGNIMTFATEWDYEQRAMQVGDTIVQQAFIPPFRHLSQKIIFAVRITEIIQEPERTGFSYETVKGHVEKGISTFTIEKKPEQKIIFKIHTFSAPGNWLTKFAGPIFSRS